MLPLALQYDSENSFCDLVKILFNYLPRSALRKDVQDSLCCMLKCCQSNEEISGQVGLQGSFIPNNNFLVNEKLASLNEGSAGELGKVVEIINSLSLLFISP